MVSMGAVVTIGGQRLPSTWDGSSMIALNDLSIDWGRSDAYDLADPGTLALSVIDPTGEWAFSQGLAGQPITVERTSAALGNLTVFRGRVTAGRPERRKVYSPVTKAREPVWIVPISAGDTLAEAASTVFAGEMGDGSVEGLGGWGEQNPELRFTNVFARGGSGVFAGWEGVPNQVTSNVMRRMHGQAASDQRTLLELIAQVYRLVPLGVVNYDPGANTVKVGSFAAASTVVLAYTGGVIGLQLPAGRIVDAGKVGVPDGIQGETTVSDAIDTVQVSYFWYGKDPNVSGGDAKRVTYTNPFLQRATARGATSGTSRVLKIDTQAQFLDPAEFASDSQLVPQYNRFPGWLADRIVEIVNTLNGQVRLPTLRLDDRRLPLDQSTTDALYRPYQSTTPLYFRGSVFNPMRNAGPQYQVIGGTLRYDRGWTHDLTVCPARNTAAADPTIADLFGTTSAAQLGQFDPDIRVGDLATITKGL